MNFRNFRKRYANQRCAVHHGSGCAYGGTVRGVSAVSASATPIRTWDAPPWLRQRPPSTVSRQESSCGIETTANRAILEPDRPLVGAPFRPCSPISESLTEELGISNTNNKVRCYLGATSRPMHLWMIFLPPLPAILASQFLRTIRRKNSIPSVAGASARPSAGRGKPRADEPRSLWRHHPRAGKGTGETRPNAIHGDCRDVPEPGRLFPG
jgi:hypothetical protein